MMRNVIMRAFTIAQSDVRSVRIVPPASPLVARCPDRIRTKTQPLNLAGSLAPSSRHDRTRGLHLKRIGAMSQADRSHVAIGSRSRIRGRSCSITVRG